MAALFGPTLALGLIWAQLFVAPSLAIEAPRILDTEPTGAQALGFVLTFSIFLPLGWLLFAVASLRARVYPPSATILLIVGAVIGGLPIPLTEIILDVAVAWLGFVLFTGRDTVARQPARVS